MDHDLPLLILRKYMITIIPLIGHIVRSIRLLFDYVGNIDFKSSQQSQKRNFFDQK